MQIEVIRSVLLWCLVINFGILMLWFVMFILAHDWIYRLHSKWFKIPVEQFDCIHYAGIVIFKMAIMLFNLVPYIALCIAT